MRSVYKQQSALDQHHAARLKKLVEVTRKQNKHDEEDVMYYNEIYNRRENYDRFNNSRKKQAGGNVSNNTNEQLAATNYFHTEGEYKSPEPKLQINRKASYLVSSVYPDEEQLFRSTSDNLYSREKAYVIEKLLNKQIRDMDFRQTAYAWVKQGLIDGTCILQLRWKYETDDFGDALEMTRLKAIVDGTYKGTCSQALKDEAAAKLQEMQNQAAVKSLMQQPETVLYDGPSVEIIRRPNFLVDTAGDKLANCDVVIVEKWERKSKLLQMQELGRLRNVELISNTTSGSNAQKDVPGTVQENVSKGHANLSDDDPMVKFFEIWERGRVSIMTERDCILLDYRRKLYNDIDYPFAVYANDPEANKFFGQSDYKTLEPHIEMTDDYYRKMIDQWDKHLKGRIWVEGKNINDDKLIKRLERGDSGVYKVKSIKGIVDDRVPLFDQSVIQGLDLIGQQMTRAIGVDNLVGGVNQLGSNIRTNSMLDAANSAGQIFTNNSAIMLAAALRRMGRLMLKLNRQFLTEPQYFAYTHGMLDFYNQQTPVYPVSGKSIPRDFDIDINIKVISDPIKQAERMEMIEDLREFGSYQFFRYDRAAAEYLSKSRGWQNGPSLIDLDAQGVYSRDMQRAQSVGSNVSPRMLGPTVMSQLPPQPQQPSASPLNQAQQQPQLPMFSPGQPPQA